MTVKTQILYTREYHVFDCSILVGVRYITKKYIISRIMLSVVLLPKSTKTIYLYLKVNDGLYIKIFDNWNKSDPKVLWSVRMKYDDTIYRMLAYFIPWSHAC